MCPIIISRKRMVPTYGRTPILYEAQITAQQHDLQVIAHIIVTPAVISFMALLFAWAMLWNTHYK